MRTAAHREQLTRSIMNETGIDDVMIERVVRAFYGRIRDDVELGPIFAARITDWAPHLEKMCAFWSSVILLSGRYHGRPMQAHQPLPIGARHFDRWLALFENTVREVCHPEAAEHFLERARRIAESLELGIAAQAGILLVKGERLPPLTKEKTDAE